MEQSNSDPSAMLPNLPRHTRRAWLNGLLTTVASGAAVHAPLVGNNAAWAEEDRKSNKPSSKARNRLIYPDGMEVISSRCKITLELTGTLLVDDPSSKGKGKQRSAKVQGKSTLDYFEKAAFTDAQLVAAARQYIEADSENWVAGNSSQSSLRDACQQTRLLQHEGTWQQYSPDESLNHREVDLIQAPVNTAVLEKLLPSEAIRPEDSWSIPSEDAAALFNLDAVHQSNLTARVSKVAKGTASLKVKGNLVGTANSVPTELKIDGNYQVKLGSQGSFVSWLGIVINEKREVSQAEPGFNIQARVRVLRKEVSDPFSVSADQLRALAKQEDLGRWLIRLHSDSTGFSLLADRRWKTFLDDGEETILRMVENNTVIAQCNISRLPDFDAGSQLTLEGLQRDIQEGLGGRFGEFLESRESVTDSGLRLIRSVVMGQAEDVPVQWIYAHLSNDAGQRVAMVFTMGGNLTDRFAGADEQMLSSFQIQSSSTGTESKVRLSKHDGQSATPR